MLNQTRKKFSNKLLRQGLIFIIGCVLGLCIIHLLGIGSTVVNAISSIATGTFSSAIFDLLKGSDSSRKIRIRLVVIAAISFLFVFLPQAIAASTSSPADSNTDPSPSPPTSSSLGTTEVDAPPTVPPPFPEVEDEIGTAISFSTPQQIENELNQASESQVNVTPLQDILILSKSFRSEISDSDEYYNKALAYLREYLNGFAHTRPNCPDDELNGNITLITFLQEANEINLELQQKRSVALYKSLMTKYESAYELAKSSTISLQLARPYAEIIEIHPRETPQQCEDILRYGVLGVQYFLETLSYVEIRSESDGDLLYRIGQIYHYLGDVPGLPLDTRRELYLTASIYLDLATEMDADDYKGYSVYYAGTVNHKLGVISGEDNASYLLRASNRYQLALYTKNCFSNTIVGDIHKYYGDVYDRLASYVNRYGRGDRLASSSEYLERAQQQYTDYKFYMSMP